MNTFIGSMWKEAHGTDLGLAEALPGLEKMLDETCADLKTSGVPGNVAYNNAREVVQKAIASRKAEVGLLKFQDTARKRFLERGGTDEEFTKAWPDLRAEHLKTAALRDTSLEENSDASYAQRMGCEY